MWKCNVASEDGFELTLSSECFRVLCTKLNTTVFKRDAPWSVDILSGGFKFSDEFPDNVNEPAVLLPLITLLRRLWAYRVSLVEGKPRSELGPTWELTKALAPKWAGFTPDRCSPGMKPIVDEVKAKDSQFAQDIERLEEELKKRKPPEETGTVH
jgi:hypothetical protein